VWHARLLGLRGEANHVVVVHCLCMRVRACVRACVCVRACMCARACVRVSDGDWERL
jgi:hypothetical protein